VSAFLHGIYVGFENSPLNFAVIFAGIFLACFIFGAPLTYDARAEDEEPR
jgi:hypothetical protein